MTASRTLLIAVLVAATVTLAGCGGGKKSSAPPPATATTGGTTTSSSSSGGAALDGTVGPGFDIALKKNGQDVTTLTPGSYVLNIDDKSSSHNFHLTGSGVDVATDPSGTGTKTFTITLKAGKYHFQCDIHPTSMTGDFTVG